MEISIELVIVIYGIAVLVAVILFVIYVIKDKLERWKMGMTIEEAIYCMQSYLPSDDYTHCTECKYYGCKDNKTCKSSEAHQKAIEIMHKYKKINDIVMNGDDTHYKLLMQIKEVIEDE